MIEKEKTREEERRGIDRSLLILKDHLKQEDYALYSVYNARRIQRWLYTHICFLDKRNDDANKAMCRLITTIAEVDAIWDVIDVL